MTLAAPNRLTALEVPPGQNLAISVTTLALVGVSVACMPLQVISDPRFHGAAGYLLGLGLAVLYAAVQFVIVGLVRRWKPLDVPFAWIGLFLIASLLYSLFFWPVVTLGLPWAAAAVAGEPFVEQFEMHTESHPKRERSLACAHAVRGGPLPEPVAPGYRLCISAGQWERLPDAPVLVTLSGDRTTWGMRVKQVIAVEVAPSP